MKADASVSSTVDAAQRIARSEAGATNLDIWEVFGEGGDVVLGVRGGPFLRRTHTDSITTYSFSK